MKRILLCIATLCSIVMLANLPSADAATSMDDELRSGDVVTVSADIQRSFNEFLVAYTGVLDWSQINGLPGSTANTARMTELRNITPLAMIEGAAYDLIKYLGTNGKMDMFADKSACMVGALTKGFGLQHTVHFAQDEMNTLQALVYTQYDDPSASVAGAREYLVTHANWPTGLRSFMVGLKYGLQQGCGLPVTV